jgi:hypothetical protein
MTYGPSICDRKWPFDARRLGLRCEFSVAAQVALIVIPVTLSLLCATREELHRWFSLVVLRLQLREEAET